MNQVKIFTSRADPSFVEDDINKFLDQVNIKLIDIKVSESFCKSGYTYTALVIYNKSLDQNDDLDFDDMNKYCS